MAVLNILSFPDERLRKTSKPVDVFDSALEKFAQDLIETMYQAVGIGLAAPQVNVHKRMMVIDVSESRDEPMCFVNPTITQSEGVYTYQEGRLSVPDVYANVERAEKITVEACNEKGEPFSLEAEGLLAVCIQHEIDHLDGKLFIDYLSPLKRERVVKKLAKAQKYI